jgi:hypothetical protein
MPDVSVDDKAVMTTRMRRASRTRTDGHCGERLREDVGRAYCETLARALLALLVSQSADGARQ